MLNRSALTFCYIDLLKKSLNNELYVEIEARFRLAVMAVLQNRVPTLYELYDLSSHSDLMANFIKCKGDGNVLLPSNNNGEIIYGLRNCLEFSHTMIGRKRLDNIQFCLETVLEDGIEGDLIETGIWRGGAIILMRGILAAYGITDRIVWGADSFAGVPIPTLTEDHEFDLSERVYPFLTVSLDQVKDLIAKYNLLDDRIRFLSGWFKDTLKGAPIDRLAILRLDGDLYESTMDALTALYEKVSPGGFVIVDDYFSCPPCKKAVDSFKTDNRIFDDYSVIDEHSIFWRKTA